VHDGIGAAEHRREVGAGDVGGLPRDLRQGEPGHAASDADDLRHAGVVREVLQERAADVPRRARDDDPHD
jgi:hypothetical protein